MSNLPNSVLNRIRQNRNRAAVPPRNDALLSQPSEPTPLANSNSPELASPADEVALNLPDLEQLTELPALTSVPPIQSPALIGDDEDPPGLGNSNTLAELKTELAKIPETHRHSAIVLEKLLDQDLSRYCKDNRITIEVFLEAAWTYAIANPDAMSQIVQEAKRRYAARKYAGKLRRLITMLGG